MIYSVINENRNFNSVKCVDDSFDWVLFCWISSMIMDGCDTLPQISSLDLSSAFICDLIRSALSGDTTFGDSRYTGAVPSDELESGDDPSSLLSLFFNETEPKTGR